MILFEARDGMFSFFHKNILPGNECAFKTTFFMQKVGIKLLQLCKKKYP
jgi:hypothetical protein